MRWHQRLLSYLIVLVLLMFSVPKEPPLLNFVNQQLEWLSQWPAGLKLNGHLVRMYCSQLYGPILFIWGRSYYILYPYLAQCPSFIALAVLVSDPKLASGLLYRFSDACMFHLEIAYWFAMYIYRYQLITLITLFRMFRGKKWNVLKKRVDNAAYSHDQLLLGTVLLCAVAFTMPTTAAFYVLFGGMRVIWTVPRRIVLSMINSSAIEYKPLKELPGDILFGYYIQ